MVLFWTKLNPIHQRMLCAKFGWNWSSGSREEDFFLISSMYFSYYVIISPWKRVGPFIWTKFNALHLKNALCQVWLKMVQWFWRRRFFNFVNVFSLFRNYLTLEEGRALHLNKTQSPSPKNALCQVWLKLAQWFWRRRFFNFVNVFPLFRNYLPFEEGRAFHSNNLESPSPKDALCQVWLKLAKWFLIRIEK